jgi:transposase
MPQLVLPVFPSGSTAITAVLALEKRDGWVTYFHGLLPIFTHAESDIASFRLITSQLYVGGACRQIDICKVFGVTAISVKRAVKLFREQGSGGFFAQRGTRGPAVLTPPVLAQAQEKLDQGSSPSEVAHQLGLKANTLRKAILADRLRKKPAQDDAPGEGREGSSSSTKSDRSIEDSEARLGMGATNTLDRVAASVGHLDGVAPDFQPVLDVPNAGVLFALPALLACGLLQHTEKYFELPKGYYQLASIFVLLAFLALCRVRSIEDLRYEAPGEWGKILGLDRVPEVRTLRAKIKLLSEGERPAAWSLDLCTQWMEASPEDASVLYVDGHVRVYHGHQTKLPRHHVARQRLCLRATVDYWVNAMDGQPFFLVNKPVDPGLLKVLEEDIVPRLEKEVPSQPTKEELEEDPLLHRFTLVFDREGYSPGFFARMKTLRIACLSYHKFPGDDWNDYEFQMRPVRLASGEVVEMELAERGIRLGKGLWLREIRKKTTGGRQVSVLSTDYHSDLGPLAAAMFARWSQENFFRYMRQHFGLDRLADYGTEDIPETVKVVNPEYRRLDGQVRREAAILQRRMAKFGSITLDGELAPKDVEQYERSKAKLQEEINYRQSELDKLKAQRKAIERHIPVSELPKDQRFKMLRTPAKHLVDTIKMVAYRAETAMAQVIHAKMARAEDARSLLREVYAGQADLLPDEDHQTLTVRLHHLAARCSDKAVENLCEDLNATETRFPGTDLRLVYEMVSSQNPRDQEV